MSVFSPSTFLRSSSTTTPSPLFLISLTVIEERKGRSERSTSTSSERLSSLMSLPMYLSSSPLTNRRSPSVSSSPVKTKEDIVVGREEESALMVTI